MVTEHDHTEQVPGCFRCGLSSLETDAQKHGNRGLGGWQCACGRFAKFKRWQNTGAPGGERGYLVDCKRCGEVLVF